MADKRSLTNGEIALLAQVFLRTLPYSKIAITDKIGLGNAPYTLPNPIGTYKYHINVGTDWFNADLSETSSGRRLLVHEATHVWQGEHRWWTWSYVFESGLCQVLSMLLSGDRSGAYDYSPGEEWTKYNAEQQAEIVEDWYMDGMATSSNLWPYIRDSIRKPGFGGQAYFFKEAKYLRWTIDQGADDEYPKSISEEWNDFIQQADASFNRLDGEKERYYFFKGSQYIRWTRGSGMDSGYPKNISDAWDSFMADGIDAALNFDNGKIYFFKGNQYIRWTWGTGKDSGYPKKIAEGWDSFMADGIDAAINWGNGKVYIFKDDQYLRWTIGSGKDSGYPKKIADTWHPFMRSGIKLALIKRNIIY